MPRASFQFSSPCPAQPQPATATHSAHRNCPAISSASKLPQRSHAASLASVLDGFDSTDYLIVKYAKNDNGARRLRRFNILFHERFTPDRTTLYPKAEAA
jgi:hypothetical protein